MALCPTNHTLTQGSLHYRLATLGYQKQNPYGVRLSHELPLRPLFLLKWLSKVEGDGGSSILQTSSAGAPLSLEWVGGEALMLRLYSKLGIFLWFSLLIHIFHQT